MRPENRTGMIALASLVLAVPLSRPTSAQSGATAVRPNEWPWSSYKDFALDKVYQDESHCLTAPEIRTDKDNPISCYCRDAIADARYVYFAYFSGNDGNLAGPFLALQQHAKEMCGRNDDYVYKATATEDWKWSGPEVVRTYPPDDVIKRIKPSGEHGAGRWVPFTVQLVYRDDQGRVTQPRSTQVASLSRFFQVKP